MPNLYVQTSDVAAYLGVDATNPAIEADLEVKIAIAEQVVEDFCNASHVYSDTPSSMILNGLGRTNLPLPKYLATLTALEIVDSEETVSSSYTLTDVYKIPASFRRDVYSSLELKDGSCFPEGLQNVKVTGTWGLQNPSNQFKLGVYLTVQNIYNLADRDANIMSATDIYRKVEYNPAIKYDKLTAAAQVVPPHAQMLLHRYQLVNKWLSNE